MAGGPGSVDYWLHKGSHAALGCATASAKGGDCASGASGAVIGEAVGEVVGKGLIQDGEFSETDKTLIKIIGTTAAIYGTSATGGDINDAADTSQNAIENNVFDTFWDVVNIGIGSAELYDALEKGDDAAAIEAAISLGLDSVAAMIPGLPGGASTLLKAKKAAKKLEAGKSLTKAESRALDAVNKAKSKPKGNSQVTGPKGGKTKDTGFKRNNDHKYHQAPQAKDIKGIPGLTKVRSKGHVKGGGSQRERYKDKKRNIYEWDYRHGRLEKYDRTGKHLGEYDPKTGMQTKPANKARSIEP